MLPFPNSQPLQVPAQIQEIAATKPKRFVASQATRNLTAAKAEQTTAERIRQIARPLGPWRKSERKRGSTANSGGRCRQAETLGRFGS